jgi:hypothetical protein
MTPRYMPCCLVCYTTELAPKPVGKREAARIATGHQNAFHHDVTILERTKKEG